MRFYKAVIAAASAATASAFLITPEIANTVSEAKHSLGEFVFGAGEGVDVKCHECPFFAADGPVEGLKDVENTVHLEFVTDAGNLKVNNETIFPLQVLREKAPLITVHQTRVDTGEKSAPLSVGVFTVVKAAVRRGHSKFAKLSGKQPGLVAIEFTITSLNNQAVLVQSAQADLVVYNGQYTLAHVRAAKFDPKHPLTLQQCTHARNARLCRLRVLTAQAARKLVAGTKHRVGTVKEWMKTHGPGNKARPCPGRLSSFERPAHGHGRHGAGHRRHWVLRFVMIFLSTVVAPILLGFAVGYTMGFIGIVVGKFIVFLWDKFYRGGRQNNARSEESAIEEGEKQGLMVEEENPPVYEYSDEAVPAYEQTEEKRDSKE